MTQPGISTVGFIGAGKIGSQVARLALASGYRVVLSNSRGPETLADLVAELGTGASAATSDEAAAAADLVVVSIPLKSIDAVPVEPMAGKVVIDTNNYYWQRDGHVAELDDERQTTAGLLQRHLPDARVVKAFNHIQYGQLTTQGSPSGTPGRRALAIFGDDPTATATVAALLDGFGFDTVDGGGLDESWRIERDQPGYGPSDDADQLRSHLAQAVRDKNG